MMRKLTNLFQKKQKQEKLPEDIFFSPRCVYYKSDMEGINSGQVQVFTLYPNLYTEESDDDFFGCFAMEFSMDCCKIKTC